MAIIVIYVDFMMLDNVKIVGFIDGLSCDEIFDMSSQNLRKWKIARIEKQEIKKC